MTNFEKIAQGGAEALVGLFSNSLRIKITTGLCQNKTHCDEKADCRGCFLKYLNSPAEPTKPTLTEDEEIFVRNAADYGVKYIARNGDGYLFIYTKKPIRNGGAWVEVNDYCVHVDTRKYPFSFVKWEDAEPWFLPDLLP